MCSCKSNKSGNLIIQMKILVVYSKEFIYFCWRRDHFVLKFQEQERGRNVIIQTIKIRWLDMFAIIIMGCYTYFVISLIQQVIIYYWFRILKLWGQNRFLIPSNSSSLKESSLTKQKKLSWTIIESYGSDVGYK